MPTEHVQTGGYGTSDLEYNAVVYQHALEDNKITFWKLNRFPELNFYFCTKRCDEKVIKRHL